MGLGPASALLPAQAGGPSQTRQERARAHERRGIDSTRTIVTFRTKEAHDARSDEQARRRGGRRADACGASSGGHATFPRRRPRGRELSGRIRCRKARPSKGGRRSPLVTIQGAAERPVPQRGARVRTKPEGALEIVASAEQAEAMGAERPERLAERVIEALQLLARSRREALPVRNVCDHVPGW